MCMWQSQEFGGAFSFGASLPLEFGTLCCACAGTAEAASAPALARNARRPIALISFPLLQRHAAACPLFVAMHGRIGLGVAHEQVDQQRNPDHAGEIVIIPALATD